MKLADKVARIGAVLDEIHPAPPIPLDHADPFTLLVAVALSAQTTDKKVNEVTKGLFARYGTPEAMAAASVEELLACIRQVGLAPTKAKNLKAMAQLLVERHGGVVPASMEALEALPGVGHKTASVVMVQAFHVPAFPVDTHIHRLAERWGLSDGSSVARTEADLKALFPEAEWSKRHLQIIYFGRSHCPALRHDPAICPICSFASRPPKAAKATQTAKSRKAGTSPKAAKPTQTAKPTKQTQAAAPARDARRPRG